LASSAKPLLATFAAVFKKAPFGASSSKISSKKTPSARRWTEKRRLGVTAVDDFGQASYLGFEVFTAKEPDPSALSFASDKVKKLWELAGKVFIEEGAGVFIGLGEMKHQARNAP
jgi:hypothetical protein